MRYIIRNCPAYSDYCEEIKSYECQDCTNCLIKQVIEKCKDVSGYSDFAFGQRDKADEILKLFEIEECE